MPSIEVEDITNDDSSTKNQVVIERQEENQVLDNNLNIDDAGENQIANNDDENNQIFDVNDEEVANYITDATSENVIEKVESNPVGVITSVVKGKDGWNWYKITYKGIDYDSVFDAASNWGTQIGKIDKTGYVREDVVTVKY